MNTTIKDCKIIKLPVIKSKRKGSITPIYNSVQIPFDIQRVYYLYDVPAGSERGGHAHKELQQLIIAASGSFDVVMNDGIKEKIFNLNRPSYGLFVPRMMWRELKNFSGGGICLVLASLSYDENDYFRNYNEFIQVKWQK
ncbi:MAG: WxcM-like domain-containing protein [Bacteroidetes bacterium]|nr:WxcM-like domain-containing protein [Bacteroidota bacterium]MBL6964380.1 WxcM-like domain-containing protein [Bacteroidota bacterium]